MFARVIAVRRINAGCIAGERQSDETLVKVVAASNGARCKEGGGKQASLGRWQPKKRRKRRWVRVSSISRI